MVIMAVAALALSAWAGSILGRPAKAGSGAKLYLPLVRKGPAAVQPPVLKWQNGGCQTTWCRTGWYASPAIADLNNDGQPEVIWSDYRILAVSGESGADLWVVDSPGGGRSWPGVVVADLDNNSSLEVITAHANGWLSVLNSAGAPLTGWPVQFSAGNELRSLAVADMDGDGDLEIAVCSTRPDNQWFLLDHLGNVLPGWPVHSPDSDTNGYAAGCFNENVGLADLDADGRAELIGPNDTHYIVGYNDDGSPMPAHAMYGLVNGQPKPWARVGFHLDHAVDLRGYANCAAGTEPLEPRPNFADSAPALVDVDNNGPLEIVVVGNQYDCRTNPYSSLYQLPYVLNADRTRWSEAGFDWTVLPAPTGLSGPLAESYTIIETVQPNPVVVDLDGDGFKEILFPSYDGRLHAYWLDKTEHHQWPVTVSDPGQSWIEFASEPAVADLNGDGFAEILFTTWSQKGSAQGGDLKILNWKGQLLHSIPLPRDFGQVWDGALPAPTLGDLDGDPDLEVVIGTAHTGLVAYDLPGSKEAQVLWSTGRGSSLRAGHP